jgi:hypothetical protein
MGCATYSDHLVEIDEHSILVRNYYYPFGDRRIDFRDIERVTIHKPTVWTGKYRYWGSGDFRTWFPPDTRTTRDAVFVLRIRDKWWRVGLTVEDSREVSRLLSERCVVVGPDR